MIDVPDYRDEVNRKCYETVCYLMESLDNGKIEVNQFVTGMDVLWMACAGLVSRKNVELMSSANEAIRLHRLREDEEKIVDELDL